MPLFLQAATETASPATQGAAIQGGYWTPEWALVLVTGLLVAVTGYLALYTYRLWKETHKSVADAHAGASAAAAQMERSSTAMESVAASMARSAEAATEAALLTKRMLTATHPPDLQIVAAELSDSQTGPLRIAFVVKNAGRSTGKITLIQLYDEVREGTAPFPIVPKRDWTAPENVHGAVLAPDQPRLGFHDCMSITAERFLEPRDSARVDAMTKERLDPQLPRPRFFFGGDIQFQTETGERHSLTFRYECYRPHRSFSAQLTP